MVVRREGSGDNTRAERGASAGQQEDYIGGDSEGGKRERDGTTGEEKKITLGGCTGGGEASREVEV